VRLANYGTKRFFMALAKAEPLVGQNGGGAVDATVTEVIGGTTTTVFPAN
jgi:hypothetical protein